RHDGQQKITFDHFPHSFKKTPCCSALKWSPGRFAYVAAMARQTRLYFSVHGSRHEHPLPSLPCGIHDERAVGRKAGVLVVTGIGQGSDLPAVQLHDTQAKTARLARNIRQPAAVGADAW